MVSATATFDGFSAVKKGTYGDLNHIKSVAMHFFLLSSYKADFSVKLYCYFSSLEIENEKSYYEAIAAKPCSLLLVSVGTKPISVMDARNVANR